MADYNERTRTNRFHVTNEDRYQELFGRLKGNEDGIKDFTITDEDGRLFHGFGSASTVDYYPEPNCANCKYAEGCGKTEDDKEECEAADFDEFVSEMQKILPEDETMIIITSGYEKLRYLTGGALVISRTETAWKDINDWAIEKAKEMVGKDYETSTSY